jgi:hypothetical protein
VVDRGLFAISNDLQVLSINPGEVFANRLDLAFFGIEFLHRVAIKRFQNRHAVKP